MTGWHKWQFAKVVHWGLDDGHGNDVAHIIQHAPDCFRVTFHGYTQGFCAFGTLAAAKGWAERGLESVKDVYAKQVDAMQ